MRRFWTAAVLVFLWCGLSALSAPGTAAQQSLDPTILDPQHFKVEFENEYVRVVRVKPEPGIQLTHTHPAPGAVIVQLTDQDMRLTSPDGATRLVSYKAGDVRWAGTTEPHPGPADRNTRRTRRLEQARTATDHGGRQLDGDVKEMKISHSPRPSSPAHSRVDCEFPPIIREIGHRSQSRGERTPFRLWRL
jgi:hypothetical protein